jgi:hypothetical protein
MKEKTLHMILFVSFSLAFVSCGDTYYEGYGYTGEVDGNYDSSKSNISITLKSDNTIVMNWSGGKTYQFWERRVKYFFDTTRNILTTDFNDHKSPKTMILTKGPLTWRIIDSNSVFDKVLSKFEKRRLEAKKNN